MLIASLHQGVCGWANSATTAWKNGHYFSAFIYSIVTRVASVAGLIFQVCYTPIYLIKAIQLANQAYNLHKINSGCSKFLAGVKTTFVALGIILSGTILSLTSTLAPELMYSKLKCQKLLYAQHITCYIDTNLGIEGTRLAGIRRDLTNFGFQFEDQPFKTHFHAVWLQNALWKNSAGEHGEPDAMATDFDSLKQAIIEYLEPQLQTLQLIDQGQYQRILQVLPLATTNSNRATPTVNSVGPTMPTAPGVTKEQSDKKLFAEIFFGHMQWATKDLIKRKCYSQDDLKSVSGGAYIAVIGTGIFNMVSESKSSNQRNASDIEFTARNLKLKLDATTDVLNLRQNFIDLKALITQLKTNREGREKKQYEEGHKLLLARLSCPEENNNLNAEIEKKRKELQQTSPHVYELESNIFKHIGALIGIMNQRIVNTVTLSNANTWFKAFEV